MATYKKLLKNRNGDTIIPFVGVIYPIGSIYMSATMSTAAEVEAALGGTWVAWGAGRVPVGVNTSETEFNTVEKTGGSKTHRHKQTDNFTAAFHTANGYAYTQGGTPPNTTINTDYATTLQPYITCYMYKRTA